MEYVTHLRPDGTYQSLREHEEQVAALAGSFAGEFGAEEHARRTGLLHDIGKYSANGQRRQRDPEHTAKVDHATAGTQLAFRMKDPFAAFAVAGHHGGLPDGGEKSNDGSGTLWARINKHLTGGDEPSAWKTEIHIPEKVHFPESAPRITAGCHRYTLLPFPESASGFHPPVPVLQIPPVLFL